MTTEPSPHSCLTIRSIPWGLILMSTTILPLFIWGAVQDPSERLWLVMIVAIGAALLFFAETGTCTLDAAQRRVFIRQSRIWRRKQWDFSFDDLQHVSVERARSLNATHSATYRLVFILKSGDRLHLTSYLAAGKSGKDRQAQQITAFIDQQRSHPVGAALDGVSR